MNIKRLMNGLGMVRWKIATRGKTSWIVSAQCVLFAASLFVFAGCAGAYTPLPLTTTHPAHPEAATATAVPPSHTLAYGPADIPSPQPTFVMARAQRPGASGQQGQQAVVGEGKVIAVVPGSGQLVVDHKEIPGFMDAMTMGYRVQPLSLLDGLKAGDAIRFTIDAQQGAIVKVDPMGQEAFVGEGKVIAVVPNTQQVVIDHGDIPGFMGAMTMGFKVGTPALLSGLNAGDKIRFTIDAQQGAIVKIDQMP